MLYVNKHCGRNKVVTPLLDTYYSLNDWHLINHQYQFLPITCRKPYAIQTCKQNVRNELSYGVIGIISSLCILVF